MKNNRFITSTIVSLFFICIYNSFVFSQNLDSFIQKTTLENSLRDKIHSEVGHVIDKTQFVVVVNLEFDTKSNMSQDLTANEQTLNTQTSNSENKNSSGNAMQFIPGFQLSGNNTKKNDSDIQYSNPQKSTSNSFSGLGTMDISKIRVNFYIEESIASPSLDKTITTLVNGIIPMIADCADCISIETMQFQKSSEQSELEKLKEKIEIMEQERREAELKKLDDKFEELQKKLERSEDQREMWEEQAILDREVRREQDAEQLKRLQDKEEAERQALEDELVEVEEELVEAESRVEEAYEERIDSETETKKELLEIIKFKEGAFVDPSGEGLNDPRLGMKGGDLSNSTFLYLVFGTMIFLLVILFLFKKNKQNVVYLKPKVSKKKSKKDLKKNKKSDDSEQKDIEKSQDDIKSQTPEPQIPPINPYATMAFEDENVVRAELKALRQSAVSMSVNQQEGATQIVKDWLADGSEVSDSESDGEEG